MEGDHLLPSVLCLCLLPPVHHLFSPPFECSRDIERPLIYLSFDHIYIIKRNKKRFIALKQKVNVPASQRTDASPGRIPRDSSYTPELLFRCFFGDSHGKLRSSPKDKRHLRLRSETSTMSQDRAGCVFWG